MAPFSISSALAAIGDDTHRHSTRATIEQLNATMAAMGYNHGVREDSRLAFNWAYGTFSADLVDITEELGFVQWLSEATTYQATAEKELRRIANDIKRAYPDLSWTDVWSIVRMYGPDIVRFAVLEHEQPAGVPALTCLDIQKGIVVGAMKPSASCA